MRISADTTAHCFQEPRSIKIYSLALWIVSGGNIPFVNSAFLPSNKSGYSSNAETCLKNVIGFCPNCCGLPILQDTTFLNGNEFWFFANSYCYDKLHFVVLLHELLALHVRRIQNPPPLGWLYACLKYLLWTSTVPMLRVWRMHLVGNAFNLNIFSQINEKNHGAKYDWLTLHKFRKLWGNDDIGFEMFLRYIRMSAACLNHFRQLYLPFQPSLYYSSNWDFKDTKITFCMNFASSDLMSSSDILQIQDYTKQPRKKGTWCLQKERFPWI